MAVSELSCRRAGPIRRAGVSDVLECSQGELLGVCAGECCVGRLSKNLVCCMPALIGGRTEKKLRVSAKENRAVASRVTHAATRMTDDE